MKAFLSIQKTHMLTFGTRPHPLPESDKFGHLRDGRTVRGERGRERRDHEKNNVYFTYSGAHTHTRH